MRIALVTRRYWPLVGGAERVMANLAEEFKRQGHQPIVVTAQWEPHWPRELVHREIPVVRLPQPQLRGWGTVRYMWELARWMRARRDRLDGVLVSMLKHDAFTTILSLGGKTPVVVRAEGGGETGDCRFHETANFGMRLRKTCMSADAIVAPSEAIERELLVAGFPRERTRFVPNGVALAPPRSESRRLAARLALAEANHDLKVGPNDPVAVYTGRLHADKGLKDLVQAWSRVVRERRAARLWLVGDGPERESLYRAIQDADLVGAVVMPGAFDQVEEILAAADVFVLPSYQEGMSMSLLEAMAAGTPIVATDIPGNRTLVDPDVQGRLVPIRSPEALAAAILATWSESAIAGAQSMAARQRVDERNSLATMARRHLELMRRA